VSAVNAAGNKLLAREPLNKSARSAFQSEKPQIVRCDTSDSSRSYGRVAQRARCGFSGETHTGRAFAGSPPRLGSLIWNDQTTLTQAKPETPAKARATAPLQGYLPFGQTALAFPPALSRPRRLVQRFPSEALRRPHQFDRRCRPVRTHLRRRPQRQTAIGLFPVGPGRASLLSIQ